jgi:hypothetical protein
MKTVDFLDFSSTVFGSASPSQSVKQRFAEGVYVIFEDARDDAKHV